MSELVLVIGTRNYSSWSLRPWMLLKHLDLPFREKLLPLDSAEFAAAIPELSPTCRVPVLLHGELQVWESLAICEYVSELAGHRGWPEDPRTRARARSCATEMHGGFAALRTACPMNIRARQRRVPSSAALAADLKRINALWSECRRDAGGSGPWLFGRYSAADAMFAPVVLRCLSYELALEPLAREYQETALADPHLQQWIQAALQEEQVIVREEVGL